MGDRTRSEDDVFEMYLNVLSMKGASKKFKLMYKLQKKQDLSLFCSVLIHFGSILDKFEPVLIYINFFQPIWHYFWCTLDSLYLIFANFYSI